MPHITEEIWHTLTQKSDQVLGCQSYPQVNELLLTQIATKTNDNLGVTKQELLNTNGPSNSQTKIEQIWGQIATVLSNLPEGVNKFLDKYIAAIILSVAVLAGLFSIKVLATVIHGINQLPFVAFSFRLLGFLVSLWFISRHVIRYETRVELLAKITKFTDEIVGELPKKTSQVESNQVEGTRARGNKEEIVLASPSQKPITSLIDTELEEKFDLVIGTIRTLRNLRAEADIKPGVKVTAILQTESSQERQILEDGADYIQDLAKVEKLTITSVLSESNQQAIAGVVGTVQVLIPLSGVVDMEALRIKIEKNLNKVEIEVKNLSNRLNNPGFVNKAPEEIVQNTRDALAEAEKQSAILQERLQRLR